MRTVEGGYLRPLPMAVSLCVARRTCRSRYDYHC